MNNQFKFLLYFSCALFLISSCKKEAAETPESAPAITGVEASYFVAVNDELLLKPTIENRVDSLVWAVNGQRAANALQYNFKVKEAGSYNVVITAYNRGNITQKVIQITVARYLSQQTNTNTILTLEASGKFAGKNDVKWEVVSAPSDLYRISGNGTPTALFTAVTKGSYQVKISSGELIDTLLVSVQQPEKNQSAFTAKVFDYLPAPGQFVNELPKYEKGDTYETILAKVNKTIVGEETSFITLGGWGGYVVLGFDHTITNVAGRRDFRVEGNAFGANSNPRPNPPFGGSCEPGIIMVAYDKNKNGKPDEDEWYEIKGSGSTSPENEPWYTAAITAKVDTRTFRNHEMTYYRPTNETPGTPEGVASIKNYIQWTNNQGEQGYKIKNTFHSQSYYPAWVKDDKLTFKGIRLAQNGMDESGQGSYFVLYAFSYGYADNFPNNDDRAGIDIDWAVDKNGNKVNLPGIDFIKVYTGVDQENGWLGENSTEVGRCQDLHMSGINIATIQQ